MIDILLHFAAVTVLIIFIFGIGFLPLWLDIWLIGRDVPPKEEKDESYVLYLPDKTIRIVNKENNNGNN